uniref:Ig-like domain-containing protein n=2 Tax=Anabas testudineus TaxID=64144 RepID=A0A3Q1IN16_ANATE
MDQKQTSHHTNDAYACVCVCVGVCECVLQYKTGGVCLGVCSYSLGVSLPPHAAAGPAAHFSSLRLLETLEPSGMDPFAFKPLVFLLCFIGCCTGQGLLPQGPLDAILGSNATLRTLVDSPSFAFITWTFNDGVNKAINIVTLSPSSVNVAKPYQGRVVVNQTNGFVTLMSLKAEDSGDYTINIISDAGTLTDDIQLRVLYPVSDVVITPNPPEAVEYNSTVVLNCSAKGSFLMFSWTNGTTAIVANSRITLKQDKTSSVLTITGVLRTDLLGPIYCTARNNLQTAQSAPFNLTVYYGPDPVTIIPQVVQPFIRSDANFTLSCSAVSSPPATFTWYHSQQIMGVSGPVLSLQAIKDSGIGAQLDNYTCLASNAKTLRAVSSPVVSFIVMDPISGVRITGPTATLIAGNSTANLSCQATAGTVKTTTWHKDGKPLLASSRVVFSQDMSSLMINPLQKEDNGEYKCHLENPVSTEKASYRMVVNFGPEPAQVTGDKQVEENRRAVFTCAAPSIPPANFTWKLNGTLTNVTTEKYVIEKADLTNSGTYTCEAYNPVTGKSTTSSFNLEVKKEGTLDHGLSDGAIAGIAIGVLVAIGAAIALTVYCRQKVPIESPY